MKRGTVCEYVRKPPDSMRTHEMYLPERISAEQMSDDELFRGLCAKSRGRLEACETCAGKCVFGRLLLARREGDPTCATTTKPAS